MRRIYLDVSDSPAYDGSVLAGIRATGRLDDHVNPWRNDSRRRWQSCDTHDCVMTERGVVFEQKLGPYYTSDNLRDRQPLHFEVVRSAALVTMSALNPELLPRGTCRPCSLVAAFVARREYQNATAVTKFLDTLPTSQLRAPLARLFEDLRAAHEARVVERTAIVHPPACIEINAVVQHLAEKTISECAYPATLNSTRDSGRRRLGFDIYVTRVATPYAYVVFRPRMNLFEGHETVLVPVFHVGVPMNWFSNVYRKGRALIEGRFVLDVVGKKGLSLAQANETGFELRWNTIIKRPK